MLRVDSVFKLVRKFYRMIFIAFSGAFVKCDRYIIIRLYMFSGLTSVLGFGLDTWTDLGLEFEIFLLVDT